MMITLSRQNVLTKPRMALPCQIITGDLVIIRCVLGDLGNESPVY